MSPQALIAADVCVSSATSRTSAGCHRTVVASGVVGRSLAQPAILPPAVEQVEPVHHPEPDLLACTQVGLEVLLHAEGREA